MLWRLIPWLIDCGIELKRGTRPLPNTKGRTIILVDDGAATGATLQVVVDMIQAQAPEYLIVAVPIAPLPVYGVLHELADEVVC